MLERELMQRHTLSLEPADSKPRLRLVLLFLLLFTFLVGSDWPGLKEYISVPTGSRHLAIGVGFLLLALISGRKSLPKSYLRLLYCVVLWAVISVINASNGYPQYFLGWLFTYFFAAIFALSYFYRPTDWEVIAVLKCLVWLVFLMSIPSFLQGLAAGVNLRWLPGGFRELGAFALSMNLALIACLALHYAGEGRKYFFVALFFILCISMTILKKSIIEYMVVIVIAHQFLLHRSSSKVMLPVGLMLFFPLLFVFLGADLAENIAENQAYVTRVGADGHVRLGMYLASLKIGLANFPFGSGYGSFGSLASISLNYSPLYFEYGIHLIGANSPSDVESGFHTLLDTFWPHIIAEAGFIGLWLFLLLFLYPIRIAWRLASLSKLHRAFAFYVIASVIVLVLDGIALYTPETPLFLLLVPGLAGFICRWMRDNVEPRG